ncbi:metallophosphoesterase [Paenibacillus fonticola]|uniref:metallophosphoesterase n=1 Tax=Paenibacillus fonticola TaxID=379896 RepID=UPI00037D18D8|nr:metallophosphoesterase [Paenibacillus fonticola]
MYITGDLHGYIDISKLNSKRFPQNSRLTKEDLVIIAGDFGLVWDNKNDEKYWRKWLNNKNFTTLFIDGNHENHNMLDSYPVEYWNGGKVHIINDSIIHLMRGQVFTINGYKIFTFGGANSHDKEHRRENYNWWAREMPSKAFYLLILSRYGIERVLVPYNLGDLGSIDDINIESIGDNLTLLTRH